MSDELLVIRKDNKIITARTENSRIVQLDAENAEEKSILGNIYIGKVKNIVKNIITQQKVVNQKNLQNELKQLALQRNVVRGQTNSRVYSE